MPNSAPVKTAVAWDADCEYYVGLDQLGEGCVGDSGCTRKLRRRVGYICEVCEERFIFFTLPEFYAHQKEHDDY